MMYPMKMIPAYKDYLWGGERLAAQYGKSTKIRPVAESWEISCHPDGKSLVKNGEYAGRSLDAVLKAHPEMLGRACASGVPFPVLIKLIDAEESTSLQVHPADEYAKKAEGQPGKNEMWYILDAKPGTSLLIGLKRPIFRAELRERIEEGTVLELVNSVSVKPGDCFLIPAGMLHAIGAGALIAEIQQSSNVTYRVYDYGRRDACGNPRTLHIDKAVDVTDTALTAENRASGAKARLRDGCISTPLAAWQWFQTELLDIKSHAFLKSGDKSFSCILAAEGKLFLKWRGDRLPLNRGESVFIPAGIGEFALYGQGKALLTRL